MSVPCGIISTSLWSLGRVDRLRVGWLSGRSAASAEATQGTPSQSHMPPSVLVSALAASVEKRRPSRRGSRGSWGGRRFLMSEVPL